MNFRIRKKIWNASMKIRRKNPKFQLHSNSKSKILPNIHRKVFILLKPVSEIGIIWIDKIFRDNPSKRCQLCKEEVSFTNIMAGTEQLFIMIKTRERIYDKNYDDLYWRPCTLTSMTEEMLLRSKYSKGVYEDFCMRIIETYTGAIQCHLIRFSDILQDISLKTWNII